MSNLTGNRKQNIAAIVLAAGGSSRMGQPKLLLPWKGEALIRWPVKTAIKAGLYPVIVVTGAASEEVIRTLEGLAIEIVHNSDWKKGQSTSVRAGISALPVDTDGVIILLGDQPMQSAALLQQLIREYQSGAPSIPIFITSYQGKPRNPVLFDRSIFQEMQNLEGDAGGKQIFSKHPVKLLPVEDPDLLLDIDSPQDYDSLKKSHRNDPSTK